MSGTQFILKRCPKDGAVLITNGTCVWCSLVGCGYVEPSPTPENGPKFPQDYELNPDGMCVRKAESQPPAVQPLTIDVEYHKERERRAWAKHCESQSVPTQPTGKEPRKCKHEGPCGWEPGSSEAAEQSAPQQAREWLSNFCTTWADTGEVVAMMDQNGRVKFKCEDGVYRKLDELLEAYAAQQSAAKARDIAVLKELVIDYQKAVDPACYALISPENVKHRFDELRAECDDLKRRYKDAERHLTIPDCKVCHGSGEFIDSESGGFVEKCHCWQNRVNEVRAELRKAEQELARVRAVLSKYIAPGIAEVDAVLDRKETK